MAIAERLLAARFNRPGHEIVDHRTYVIAGDGDMMEGVAQEAASLAGHLGLGKLVCFYDSNHICLAGATEPRRSPKTSARRSGLRLARADAWPTATTSRRIERAIDAAKAVADRPSLVIVRTEIGYGSPKQGTSAPTARRSAPSRSNETKRKLGCPSEEPFFVPDEALAALARAVERGKAAEADVARRASTPTARRTPSSRPSSSACSRASCRRAGTRTCRRSRRTTSRWRRARPAAR